MKRSSFSRLLLVVFLVLLAASIAQAQDNPPLVMLISGDFWAWDGEGAQPRRLTTWGFNHEPLIWIMNISIRIKHVCFHGRKGSIYVA